MVKAEDSVMLHVVVRPDLLKRLDDYRFEKRFPSRSAALKYLLDWALKQNPEPKDS